MSPFYTYHLYVGGERLSASFDDRMAHNAFFDDVRHHRPQIHSVRRDRPLYVRASAVDAWETR